MHAGQLGVAHRLPSGFQILRHSGRAQGAGCHAQQARQSRPTQCPTARGRPHRTAEGGFQQARGCSTARLLRPMCGIASPPGGAPKVLILDTEHPLGPPAAATARCAGAHLVARTGEAADDGHVAVRVHRVAHIHGDRTHSLKVVGGGYREARLDDINAWGCWVGVDEGGVGGSMCTSGGQRGRLRPAVLLWLSVLAAQRLIRSRRSGSCGCRSVARMAAWRRSGEQGRSPALPAAAALWLPQQGGLLAARRCRQRQTVLPLSPSPAALPQPQASELGFKRGACAACGGASSPS